jgi:MFS superfamily sulfate permease-like transporter
VVGFTIGIAFTIALSQAGEILGLKAKLSYEFVEKMHGIMAHAHEFSIYAVIIALATFAISKALLKVSPFIPAPLIGIAVGTLLASTVWADKGLVTIKDKFGDIPSNLLTLTAPVSPFVLNGQMMMDLAFFVVAIVFVSAVESLLCSRMADRLAENKGTPYHANKELWGQGMVQILVPLVNGFPHTGALARTATNIKLGALSPMAGIFKCVLKLVLAAGLANYLEMVPMACVGGILLYVATGMVKWPEVKEVLVTNKFHVALMLYTAVAVIATDFLKGVLSAVILYAILGRFFDKPGQPNHDEPKTPQSGEPVAV